MTRSKNLIGRFNLDNPNDVDRLQRLRKSVRWYNGVSYNQPQLQRRIAVRGIRPEVIDLTLIQDTMDKYLCSWSKAVKVLKTNYPVTAAKVVDVYVYRKVP